MFPRPFLLRLRSALLALGLLAACASPPVGGARSIAVADLEQRLEQLAEEVERDRAALHVPGLALAIVKDDRVVFARGFGLADLEHERPVTPETLFAIGSSTKAFTATLAGMLADEGRMDLDDPVTKYLPWFELPVRADHGEKTVTLRDLLSHRTGFARMDILWAAGLVPPEEVLRTATRAEPWAPFRREFHYNNIMFLAAGQACAAVTGKGWDALVRERIFEPLGMNASSTSVREAQRDPRLALGYLWDDEQQEFERRTMRVLDSIAPAGAINSSALDMARWVRFLLGRGELEGRRLIREERLQETWRQSNEVGPEIGYGLGWFLRVWRDQPYVEHGGNIDGFAAEVALLPESTTGVVLLANVTATPLQGTIGPKVFDALFGEPPPPPAPAAEREDLARYTGVYVANFFQFHDAQFTVLVQDDRLAVDVPGQMVFELEPPGPDGKRPFAFSDQIAVSFVEEQGQVVGLKLYQAGFTFEVPRQGYVPAPEIPLAELQPYLGSYTDPANDKTFQVVIQHNRLALDYPEQMVYELFPPDAQGKRLCRITDQLGVLFHGEDSGTVHSLTFFERGSERLCPRVGAEGFVPPPPIEEVLALRRSRAFEQRLAQLGPCRLVGKMRLVHCGIEGRTEIVFDPGGRFREEVDLSPFARTRTSFDGEHVWFDSTLEPFRELEGKSREQSLTQSPAHFFGDWKARFDSAEVVRVAQTGGRKAFVVKLRKGAAPPILVHVDAESGDIARAEIQEVVEGLGTFPKSMTFEEWREVEGLRLPLRYVTEDDATGRVVVDFEGLDAGVEAGDELFTLKSELYSR